MNILRIFSIFIINCFIFISLSIRFLGTPIIFWQQIKFKNYDAKNQYFQYKKIAAIEKKPNIHAIVLIPGENLQIIPIYKTAIGKTKEGKIIDSANEIYDEIDKDIAGNGQNLITVEGNYKKWPKYYERLSKLSIFTKIYHITLYEHTCDIWVMPGVLVQLDENIENLEEFYKNFPQLFMKGKLIDIRCTKRIGISNIKIPKIVEENKVTKQLDAAMEKMNKKENTKIDENSKIGNKIDIEANKKQHKDKNAKKKISSKQSSNNLVTNTITPRDQDKYI